MAGCLLTVDSAEEYGRQVRDGAGGPGGRGEGSEEFDDCVFGRQGCAGGV